jgi:protein regulator of cytokinesis 1
MHVFVEAARETLQNLWEELFYTEEQMAEFTPAFTGTSHSVIDRGLTPDIFTDASLASHEYEVKRLEALVVSRQNALGLVKRHMDLLAEKQHLEESSKDPSRLTQRGAQAAGRLLQEEKVRKKLNKELPKVPPPPATYLINRSNKNWRTCSRFGRMKLEKTSSSTVRDIWMFWIGCLGLKRLLHAPYPPLLSLFNDITAGGERNPCVAFQVGSILSGSFSCTTE